MASSEFGLSRGLLRGVAAVALVLGVSACTAQTADHAADAIGARRLTVGNTATGNYLCARHALAMHDYGLAADYMLLALKDDPESLDVLRQAYLLTAEDGRMKESAALAKQLTELSATEVLPNVTLALDAAKDGRWKEAQHHLDAAPNDALNNFLRPLLTAWVLEGQGKPDDAVAVLNTMKQIRGFAALADLHIGLVNDLARRPAAAEAAYAAALAESGGDSYQVVAALGNFLERQGKAAAAERLYQTYARNHPDSAAISATLRQAGKDEGTKLAPVVADAQQGLAEALFGVATVMRSQNLPQMALYFGRSAQDLRPDFPINQMLLADVLDQEGRQAQAADIYAAIPASSPFSWSAQLRHALLLADLGRYAEADRDLRTMAAEQPDRPDALIALGDLLRRQDRFPDAVKAYDGAISRIAHPTAGDWALYYARGVSLERARQWPQAEADFEHALRLSPDQPLVLNYLGYSWIVRGTHLKEARDMIARAVALRPDDGYIVDSLGWAMYRLGNFQQAVQDLERAVELRPGDPTINDHLGDAYWKVGRHDEARFQWERALVFKPDATESSRLEEKLKLGLDGIQATAEKP